MSLNSRYGAAADFTREIGQRRRALVAYLRRNSKRLDAREEANFLRQLSLMIEAGIPFTDALRVLETTMHGRSSELARRLGDSLYQGQSLSRAFFLSADQINEVAAPLVEAGEASGGLVKTLHIAADWAELTADLRAKMKAALTYPAFVLGVNLLLAGAMLGYVFPAFIPLFQGEQLPLLTRFFLGCSWLASSRLFWVVALLAAIEGFLFFSQPEHKEKLHRFCLLMPALGPLLRSAARTRFCAVLAVTTRTGLPVMKGLTLAARASGDPEFAELDAALQRQVREGAPLHEHFLEHSDVYGVVLSHGIALCQATGNTDTVCSHLANLFRSEADGRVQQFQALMEPLLIALVSLTTATLLLSIYWPLGKFLQSLVS